MIQIGGKDSVSETVAAEQVSADTFRILENPVFHYRINYGTIVKVVAGNNGELVFSTIEKPSPFITRILLLSSAADLEKEPGKTIAASVIQAGGYWELAMGGLFFIHKPADSALDIDGLFLQNGFQPVETKGE